MTSYSPNSIKPIREELIEKGEYPVNRNEVYSFCAIDSLKNLINGIEKIINTHQLKEKEKIEWERLLESLKKIIHAEVDERITKEREDAIKKRDKEWNKIIEEQYVKKEIVNEKDNTIENLKNDNKKKDDTNIKNQTFYDQNISKKQDEIDSLKNQKSDIIAENFDLMNKNIQRENYINNRLDNDVRFGQNELSSNIQIFNKQKNEFENYKNNWLTFFKDSFQKMNKEREYLNIFKDILVKEKEKIYTFLELFFKDVDFQIKTNKGQSFEEQGVQKLRERLEDINNYFNSETNQKNNKISSENHTHQEYNQNEKEKLIKVIIPINNEQKPAIITLDPNNIP